MSEPWVLVVGLSVVTALALLLLGLGHRTLTRTRHDLALLQQRVDRLVAVRTTVGSERAEPSVEPRGFVITELAAPESTPPQAPASVEGWLFADLVLRETVVRAAALAHGVRRALAPETRNRIRFEVRREVKRARKQRRADVRTAVREWQARQRAQIRLDEGDEDAA